MKINGHRAKKKYRLGSIDCVRGLVMILMALDHVRDFFSSSAVSPNYDSPPAIFLTRWITHFCAPAFILLAGTAAWFYGNKTTSKHQLSRFLFTRGSLLILLEVTIVRLGWTFHPGFEFILLQVIWVIGLAMIVLSVVIFMPDWMIAVFAIVMIFGHNLLDDILYPHFFGFGWVWNLLHQPGVIFSSDTTTIYVAYPLIPWAGVMAAGYAFAPLMTLKSGFRRKILLGIGTAITILFFIFRAGTPYGDPFKWFPRDEIMRSVFAFMDCTKYPPSLEFLLMTLGPIFIALALCEGKRGGPYDVFRTFGRVPLLFYLIHLPVIHGLAVIMEQLVHGNTRWLFHGFPPGAKPAYYGYDMLWVYLIWIFVIIALYPICRGLASAKQNKKSRWVSYF